jgi:hypothetical protein
MELIFSLPHYVYTVLCLINHKVNFTYARYRDHILMNRKVISWDIVGSISVVQDRK